LLLASDSFLCTRAQGRDWCIQVPCSLSTFMLCLWWSVYIFSCLFKCVLTMFAMWSLIILIILRAILENTFNVLSKMSFVILKTSHVSVWTLFLLLFCFGSWLAIILLFYYYYYYYYYYLWPPRRAIRAAKFIRDYFFSCLENEKIDTFFVVHPQPHHTVIYTAIWFFTCIVRLRLKR